MLVLAVLVSISTAPGSQAPKAAPITLREAVKIEGLPLLIATNHLGLGAETRRLVAWALVHRGPLTLRPADLALEDAGANSLKVSPLMARTLARLSQWHGLAATSDHPITHEQLEAATLLPASVDRIRRIFEMAIGRGVRIGATWVIPETGGEATIDRELRLVEALDPRWSTIQDLVKVSDDPKAIAALCESRALEVAQVDGHGLLKVAVARLRLGAVGSSEEVRRALLTVTQNAAPTFSLGPEEQLTLITAADWEGRYVGGWHTHAPHDGGDGWVGGDVPSFEDMQNAVQYGQYLTLAFQPDGFDLYDAEPLAEAKRVDLALLKVIRYRSRSWRQHFEKLHSRAEPRGGGGIHPP